MQTLNFNGGIEYRTHDQHAEAVAFYDMMENGFSEAQYLDAEALEDFLQNVEWKSEVDLSPISNYYGGDTSQSRRISESREKTQLAPAGVNIENT